MAAKAGFGVRNFSRWRLGMWGGAASLLLVPLVAMQFTDEVNWDETDFIVMGTMLAAACGTIDLAARMTGSWPYRSAVAIAVGASFLLVWMNLAVGIIGTEDNPLNLIYGAVIAVALGGALLARFEARGMAMAMVAAAVAQGLAGAVALASGHFTLVLEAFFAGLWLMSAALFRKAKREQRGAAA